MKVSAILILAACLQTSARSYSQTVTLYVTNTPVEKVLREIRTQTGYDFFYNLRTLDLAGNVSLHLSNVTINEALDACFQNTPLTYTITDKIIVINEKRAKPFSGITDIIDLPPPVDVHGRITDSLGRPLAAVNILIRGSRKGTTTNDNGEFSLPGINGNSILMISSVGYESQEIKLNGRTDLVIQMKIGVTSMQNIVINKGYYKTSQLLNTGNVTRVDGADIEKQPITDPIVALEGRVPGLYIQQTSGLAGANPIVRIRGQNSIKNGNDPLYIIDGVPFPSSSIVSTLPNGAVGAGDDENPGQGLSPFNNLDPANIESIEVLKDADATAIYGSRGANGVILITTKRGKPGKTIVDINARQGIANIASSLHLMNTRQYLDMRRQAFKNDGKLPDASDYDVNGTWDTTRYTDWQKVFIGGTAQTTNLNGSLSGGNATTQFNLGGGFSRQTTVSPGDYADRHLMAHINLQHASINQKLHASFSASYSNDNNVLPTADFTGSTRLAPDAPALYNPDGTINWGVYPGLGRTFFNPIARSLLTDRSTTENLTGDVNLTYELFPGLLLKANFGYGHLEMNQSNKTPAASVFGPIDPNNRLNELGISNNISWIFEPEIDYATKINKGKLDVQVVMTQNQNEHSSISYAAAGFGTDALINNPGFASFFGLEGTTGDTKYRYVALFTHVNYNWDDKYLLNLSARRDGSSRFGPGREFAKFGSIGAGWIFSREKWTDRVLPWLSFGKLRASYGTTGSDAIGDYGYVSAYSSYYSTYQGTSTLFPTNLQNPYYGWETNNKLEGALDLGFCKNRINFSLAYYRNRSGNQLIYQNLAQAAGFNAIITNLPALVQNSGVELELNTTNVKTKSFTWTSSFNISFLRNKLVAFPGLAQNLYYASRFTIGHSIFDRKVYHFTGIDPQTGLYTYQDVNKDGKIDMHDQVFSITPGVKYHGGFDNNFSYKGLSLDAFFTFTRQIGANYSYDFEAAGFVNANLPVAAQNSWKNPGDHAVIQRYTTGVGPAFRALGNLGISDIQYSSASFIRLKTLQLSYRLPASWLKKMSIQNFRVFLTGQNLLTITNYLGLDPENMNVNSLPPLRVFTAGVEIGL